MTIKLYNTVTRRKEIFEPLEAKKVGFYACGPTVYDYFHIGNARVFIVFDMIRRYLKSRGYDVTFVQNFTDVEDKMIKRAVERDISLNQLAEEMIAAYFEDAGALGVKKADHHPRATLFIPQMIEIIERLVAKGLAYEHSGDVYFSVVDFPGYGKLSGQPLEELFSGVRVEMEEGKKHPGDFALWKKQKPGEPAWDSPWGRGRPGWHIECTAMSMEYLGETIDIHAGGPDLIFPHHENEVAQSEGATGKPFVRYWLHAGYLNIDREKMSKSKGNFLTVREMRKRYDPQVVRFFMLSAHYRNPINFSPELLTQAKAGLDRLRMGVLNLKERIKKVPGGLAQEASDSLSEVVMKARHEFTRAMDDDFNTADAIAALFELVRDVNTYLNKSQGLHRPSLQDALTFYEEVDEILGFIFPAKEETALDEDVEAAIQEREKARSEKDWARADAIRDELKDKGIILEDTPHGIRWRRK